MILGIAAVAVVVTLVVYRSFFPDDVDLEHARWGEFGDFLGGTLNPLFGLLGLLALLLTVLLQSRELSNSTKELANSVSSTQRARRYSQAADV